MLALTACGGKSQVQQRADLYAKLHPQVMRNMCADRTMLASMSITDQDMEVMGNISPALYKAVMSHC